MATLTNSRLNITVNLPTKTARVVVTSQIRFTQLERFLMQNGLRFRLDCKIWGEDRGQDALIDSDDHLFHYASIFYPDATPTDIESVTFDRTVTLKVLDEDSSTDEIYGELILKNLQDASTAARQRTNVVEHQFG
jgi:hypothetical protein